MKKEHKKDILNNKLKTTLKHAVSRGVYYGILISIFTYLFLFIINIKSEVAFLSWLKLFIYLLFSFILISIFVSIFILLLLRLFSLFIGKYSRSIIDNIYFAIFIIITLGYSIAISQTSLGVSIYDKIYNFILCLMLLLGWMFYRRLTHKKIAFLSVLFLIICLTVPIFSGYNDKKLPGKKEIANQTSFIGEIESPIKVILLGIDGASWDIIFPMFSMGKLPAIRCLKDHGAYGNLKSLQPMRSPLIWTSIATGKAPSKHGITGFVGYNPPFSMDILTQFPSILNLLQVPGIFEVIPVTSSQRRCAAIWNILSSLGGRVAIIGWWATWPAEQVNGLMVSDRIIYSRFNPLSHGKTLAKGQTYPPEMIKDIKDEILIPDQIDPSVYKHFFDNASVMEGIVPDTMNPLYEFQLAYAACETYRNIFEFVSKMRPRPHLRAVYYEGIDNVSHFFYKEMNPEAFEHSVDDKAIQQFGKVIPRFYCYQDEIIAEALSTFDCNSSVIICSDHGFIASKPGAYEYFLFKQFPTHSGTHQENGVLVMAGDHIVEDYLIHNASVLDITPTILYMFSLPIAMDMDGKVLQEALRIRIPPKQVETYEYISKGSRVSSTHSQFDALIKEKLKGLGYIK